MKEPSRSIYAFICLLLIGGLLIVVNSKGPSKNITEDEIMNHIRYLSHENREGRLPGSRGSKDAIAYLIKELKSYGVSPGYQGSYTQPFDIKTGISKVPGTLITVTLFFFNLSLEREPLIRFLVISL